jgi:hypothetical protein
VPDYQTVPILTIAAAAAAAAFNARAPCGIPFAFYLPSIILQVAEYFQSLNCAIWKMILVHCGVIFFAQDTLT